MNINWSGTITAGEMIQVIAFLIAVFGAYNRISIKLSQLETKLDPLWEHFLRNQHGD